MDLHSQNPRRWLHLSGGLILQASMAVPAFHTTHTPCDRSLICENLYR
jgi:hypothetical protein